MKNQNFASMKNENVELPLEEWRYVEQTPTSPSTIIWVVIILSIPLGLCCYVLLKLL